MIRIALYLSKTTAKKAIDFSAVVFFGKPSDALFKLMTFGIPSKMRISAHFIQDRDGIDSSRLAAL